jgi:hypothetical protein
MLKIGKITIILILCGVAVSGAAQSPPLPSLPIQPPIRVDITQHTDPEPAWAEWVSLAEKIAWPIMALFDLLVFRKPLSTFLDVVGERATEISIGGLGIKLPTMIEQLYVRRMRVRELIWAARNAALVEFSNWNRYFCAMSVSNTITGTSEVA